MSRSFTAACMQVGYLRPLYSVNQGRLIWVNGTQVIMLLGFIRQISLLISGSLTCKQKAIAVGSQEDCGCFHNVVFGVKTAEPTARRYLSSCWWWPSCQFFLARQSVLLGFLSCSELMERVAAGSCIIQKKKTQTNFSVIVSPGCTYTHKHTLFSHSIPHPPSSTCSSHSWVGVRPE